LIAGMRPPVTVMPATPWQRCNSHYLNRIRTHFRLDETLANHLNIAPRIQRLKLIA
jgi:hypothetical protein